MKCKNCGFDIGDFPFCPKCGSKAQEEPGEVLPVEVLPHEQTSSEEVNDSTTEKNEDTPTVEKKNKKIIPWIIAGVCFLLFLFIVIAGNSGRSKPSASSSTNYSSSSSSSYAKVGFTDSELEALACSALYDKLISSKSKQGVPLTNWYNIGATTYSIGSIKGNSTDGWTVKGTFNLYNDYGEYRKSGTFSVKISSFGYTT